MECEVCHYTLHAKCFNDHKPCPDGWNSTDKSVTTDPPGAFNSEAPVTPPVAPPAVPSQATAIYQHILHDMEQIQTGQQVQQYPNSPALHGQSSIVPLANLGIATGVGGVNSGYAVQYGKPREADAIKLLTFPKPGTSFEKWWDHALDSISAATSFCTEAYRWAIQCEKPETTFADLAESGGFVRLDALLLTALMECIPGDTHLLRQEI